MPVVASAARVRLRISIDSSSLVAATGPPAAGCSFSSVRPSLRLLRRQGLLIRNVTLCFPGASRLRAFPSVPRSLTAMPSTLASV